MMKINTDIQKWLPVILWLVSLHSFFVGIGLIIMPDSFMLFFGFEIPTERFFSAQGGVFHLIMSFAFAFAATDIEKHNALILLAIITKFSATIFLFIFYLLINNIWTVLFSGICDFLMGMIIFIFYLQYKKRKTI